MNVQAQQTQEACSDKARHYTLFVLTATYAFHVLDRYVIAVLLPQIKSEMEVNDLLLGLMTGPAFAVFYSILAVPLALLSDRSSRKTIIAACTAFFSLMTCLSGLATSFVMLLWTRIGVAIGESGTSPAAISMISDLYPMSRRNRALAIFSVGSNIGLTIGFILSGYIAVTFGWRYAFLVAGIPGILLAIITALTVKDPGRGMADNKPASAPVESPELLASTRFLIRQRSFVLNTLGMAMILMPASALVTWFPSFMLRSFGMSVSTSGILLGLVLGLTGILGTYFIGGRLADRLCSRDIRWGSWLVAIFSLLAIPAYLLICLGPSVYWAVTGWVLVGSLGLYFQAPTFAMIQAVTPPAMRSTSSALMLLGIQILGVALGSFLIGVLSDFLKPEYGQEALRYAMLALPVPVALGIIFYMLASRYLKEDITRVEAY